MIPNITRHRPCSFRTQHRLRGTFRTPTSSPYDIGNRKWYGKNWNEAQSVIPFFYSAAEFEPYPLTRVVTSGPKSANLDPLGKSFVAREPWKLSEQMCLCHEWRNSMFQYLNWDFSWQFIHIFFLPEIIKNMKMESTYCNEIALLQSRNVVYRIGGKTKNSHTMVAHLSFIILKCKGLTLVL